MGATTSPDMAYHQPTSPERWSSSSHHTMGRACNEESDAARIRAEGDRTQSYTNQIKQQRFDGSNSALQCKLSDLERVAFDLSKHAEQVDQDHATLLCEHDTVISLSITHSNLYQPSWSPGPGCTR